MDGKVDKLYDGVGDTLKNKYLKQKNYDDKIRA